ncbi:class C sortase [Bifidobacterium eulemuris]|uniref:Sortase n=1 Tax=Bifidobacterium eulemuris TaxID=1765219 RepID=A0A261GDT7_9BIFI|nr:class C sortase [Bifidobacterium eulemuris]OZG69602.1 sortase [Bifidobacterium eulemuris]QOL32281.1 class C sortase [Bifidobacterium eulemuris]
MLFFGRKDRGSTHRSVEGGAPGVDAMPDESPVTETVAPVRSADSVPSVVPVEPVAPAEAEEREAELSDFDESVEDSAESVGTDGSDESDRPLVNLAVVLGKKAAEARAAELAARRAAAEADGIAGGDSAAAVDAAEAVDSGSVGVGSIEDAAAAGNPVNPAKPVKPLSPRARRRLPVVAAVLPHAPLVWSWSDWLAVCGEDRRRAGRAQKRSAAWLVIALILISASLFIGLRPFALQAYNTLDSAYVARAFDEEVAQWPSEEQKAALEAAEAYNAELAASPQTELGEGADPFGDDPDVSRSQSDERYQSLLSLNGSGAMATIEIPSISVYLTIAHGTSDEVLTSRAGHLYGTSLPVGGENTNSVIAAHRGLPDKLMFTRVDELRSGDVMYIHVLGETLGYKVFDVQITDPDDTTYLRVEEGRDLLTLFTCTPYGVNTQRLIIRAERAVIPDMIPDSSDAPGDPVLVGLLVFFMLVVPALVVLRVWRWFRERHLRPYPHPHHASELWFGTRRPSVKGRMAGRGNP